MRFDVASERLDELFVVVVRAASGIAYRQDAVLARNDCFSGKLADQLPHLANNLANDAIEPSYDGAVAVSIPGVDIDDLVSCGVNAGHFNAVVGLLNLQLIPLHRVATTPFLGHYALHSDWVLDIQ